MDVRCAYRYGSGRGLVWERGRCIIIEYWPKSEKGTASPRGCCSFHNSPMVPWPRSAERAAGSPSRQTSSWKNKNGPAWPGTGSKWRHQSSRYELRPELSTKQTCNYVYEPLFIPATIITTRPDHLEFQADCRADKATTRLLRWQRCARPPRVLSAQWKLSPVSRSGRRWPIARPDR